MLEKFVRISGVHTGIRYSKQLVLTEELLMALWIVNNNKKKNHLSLRDKWNFSLWHSTEAVASPTLQTLQTLPLPRPLALRPLSPARFYSAPAIYSLFVHISDERQRDRLTNKSLVCTKLYLFYSSWQESWNYWQKNVNNILLPTRRKVSQREKKVIQIL